MNKQPSIRMVVMAMVGAVLIGGGVNYWANGAAKAAKTRYETLVAEVPNEGELRQMVTDSQTKVDEYKLQLQHLEQSVPGMAYVPTLLTELEMLGKQHNIAVTGVRPVIGERKPVNTDDKASGSEKKKPYQEMSIDISGRGSYENVMQVVEALKKFPKIIAIQTVGLQPKKDTSQKGDGTSEKPAGVVLDATVRIKAYLFPMPQSGGDSKTTQGATS